MDSGKRISIDVPSDPDAMEDRTENYISMKQGFRALSSYRTLAGDTIWVITEADRSLTTLLLPDED